MEGFFIYFCIASAIALVCLTIFKGLEWIMPRFGLSSSKKTVLSDQDMAATVIEPFIHENQEKILKGKVHYHGEIWNAYCDADLASIIKKNDKVEVIRNKDLSVKVQRKLDV